MSVALRVLTNSEMKTRRRCARLHHLRYNLGYKPIEDAATLRFGDLWHQGLEVWWGWHRDAAEHAPAYDFAADAPLELALAHLSGLEIEAFERVKLTELLRGYHYRWSMAMADLEVIAVEVEFRCPLINPETGAASRTFEQGGKLDVLVRERSIGRVLIVEHKTSSEDVGVGSTYWKRLRMDSQISTYLSGAEALGHVASACLYDVIAKPTIRPSKATPMEAREYTKPKYRQCPECKKKPKKGETALPPPPHVVSIGEASNDATGALFVATAMCEEGETPESPRRICTDPGGKLYANLRESDETAEEFRVRLRESIAAEPDRYYQRGEVVRLEEELRDHAFDLWAHGRAIADDLRTGRAPKNPDSCVAYGRDCGFFALCAGEASINDITRFEKLTNVHSELAAPAAPGEAA